MISELSNGRFAVNVPGEPVPRICRTRSEAERILANAAVRAERVKRADPRPEREDKVLYRATPFGLKVFEHARRGWTDDPEVAAAIEEINAIDAEIAAGEEPAP